jgi:putative oxidoreductase
MKIIIVLLKIIIAIIFMQSLFYKFSAHPQAVHIFNTLNIEPIGRISIGIVELILVSLLFIKRYSILATLGSLIIMLGALYSHLFTPLGIVVRWDGQSDEGKLFMMALIVIILSSILIFLQIKNINTLLHKFKH